MRYIREYNHYSIEGIEEITYDDYSDRFMEGSNIPFTKREIDELISVIKDQCYGDSYRFVYDFEEDVDGEEVGVLYTYALPMININGIIHYNRVHNIDVDIEKYEDEWFYVRLGFKYSDNLYYKCDQFDSLIKFIKSFSI
jgi:hypothetical protein